VMMGEKGPASRAVAVRLLPEMIVTARVMCSFASTFSYRHSAISRRFMIVNFMGIASVEVRKMAVASIRVWSAIWGGSR